MVDGGTKLRIRFEVIFPIFINKNSFIIALAFKDNNINLQGNPMSHIFYNPSHIPTLDNSQCDNNF